MPKILDKYKSMTMERVIRLGKINGRIAGFKGYKLDCLESRAKEKFPELFQVYIDAYMRSYIKAADRRKAESDPELEKIKVLAKNRAEALSLISEPISTTSILNEAVYKYGSSLGITYTELFLMHYENQSQALIYENTCRRGFLSGKKAANLNIPFDLESVRERAVKRRIKDIKAYLKGYEQGYKTILSVEIEIPKTPETPANETNTSEQPDVLATTLDLQPFVSMERADEVILEDDWVAYFKYLQNQLMISPFENCSVDDCIQPSNPLLISKPLSSILNDPDDQDDVISTFLASPVKKLKT